MTGLITLYSRVVGPVDSPIERKLLPIPAPELLPIVLVREAAPADHVTPLYVCVQDIHAYEGVVNPIDKVASLTTPCALLIALATLFIKGLPVDQAVPLYSSFNVAEHPAVGFVVQVYPPATKLAFCVPVVGLL